MRDYEGGKSPFTTYRVPEFGSMKKKLVNEPMISAISLSKIQRLIDAKILDPTKKITMREIFGKRISAGEAGLAIIPSGLDDFHTKIDIEATRATTAVIQKIISLGGTFTRVYTTPEMIDYYKNPSDYFFEPPQPFPHTRTQIEIFTDPKKGGYLSYLVEEGDSIEVVKEKILKLHNDTRGKFIKKLLTPMDSP